MAPLSLYCCLVMLSSSALLNVQLSLQSQCLCETDEQPSVTGGLTLSLSHSVSVANVLVTCGSTSGSSRKMKWYFMHPKCTITQTRRAKERLFQQISDLSEIFPSCISVFFNRMLQQDLDTLIIFVVIQRLILLLNVCVNRRTYLHVSRPHLNIDLTFVFLAHAGCGALIHPVKTQSAKIHILVILFLQSSSLTFNYCHLRIFLQCPLQVLHKSLLFDYIRDIYSITYRILSGM